MSENIGAAHPADRHLTIVASGRPVPDPADRFSPQLTTTTHCRPSELPTTLALSLTEPALRRAAGMARGAALDVPTWVRLAIEATRQASRAATLMDLALDDLHVALDEAATIPIATRPMIAAPMTAYLHALRDRRRRTPPPAGGRDELIIHVSDELAVAWTTQALEAGESLGVWASLQIDAAPRDVVAWELAAARRGCYLGEWVLAAAAAAKRSSARPQA